MHRSIRIVSVLVGCGLSAAAGVASPEGATAEKPFTHVIVPRQIAEECVKLAAGQSIGYSFDASAPVDFNIHFHRGNDVVYPVKTDQVQRRDDRFTAIIAQDYCLMWTNATPDRVTVKGRLGP
jgi:hypothetical protein